MEKIKHYSAFLIAGGCAFIINLIILLLLITVLDLNPYLGQFFGLWGSITSSWWINRTWTFPSIVSPTIKEYVTYCTSMLVSSLVNYICYVLALQIHETFITYPILALFPATLISMVVSYVGMKFFIYKK